MNSVFVVCATWLLSAAPISAVDAHERMLTWVSGHHPVPAKAFETLTATDFDALAALADDPALSIFARGRALGFLGARPDARSEGLWATARRSPHAELRIQAAYAQAVARKGQLERLRPFLLELLSDGDARIREVGVQALFALRLPGGTTLARAQLEHERDPVNRALLVRRLSAKQP